MAFPKEAFVADLPYPDPEPITPKPIEVTEDGARAIFQSRVDAATKNAKRKLRGLRGGVEYPLFDYHYGGVATIRGADDLNQGLSYLGENADVQKIALDMLETAGLDQKIYSVVSVRRRGNGTFAETRKYPSKITKGLEFQRQADLTAAEQPIQVSWYVRG
jgi:hypothetical protein